MADQKLTELTEATTVEGGDIMYVVRDPTGSVLQRKITINNLFNHSYYTNLAALLEPDAIEPLQHGAFSYVVASDEVKYLLASWNTRLGSAGRMEQRDPKTSLSLRNVTLTGLSSTSTAAIIDPTLPTYTNARDTYFDRLNTILTYNTKYLGISGANGTLPFLPGAYGAIILQATCFDYSWIILQCIGNDTGINLGNEINDSHALRYSNTMFFPINKLIVNRLLGSGEAGGYGGLVYVLLPSTWSAVTDATSYDFRDDFMGASLDTGSDWTKVESSVGNVEIDTLYQWCKVVGNSNWGTNGAYSQSSISRANGKVFLCDVYISSAWNSNGYGIFGFSDGGGQSYSNFSHGINFGGNGGSPQLQVFENGTSRGGVGSGYSSGCTYRLRITLGASNNAAYAIQGGTQYQSIGSSSWTDITPGTTSSSTTPLHAGFSMFQDTVYVSDVKIY